MNMHTTPRAAIVTALAAKGFAPHRVMQAIERQEHGPALLPDNENSRRFVSQPSAGVSGVILGALSGEYTRFDFNMAGQNRYSLLSAMQRLIASGLVEKINLENRKTAYRLTEAGAQTLEAAE